MGDTLITLVAIFLAAILMFVFPLMAVSENQDDVTQLALQTATEEFVTNATTKGYIKYVIRSFVLISMQIHGLFVIYQGNNRVYKVPLSLYQNYVDSSFRCNLTILLFLEVS